MRKVSMTVGRLQTTNSDALPVEGAVEYASLDLRPARRQSRFG